jgi:hypothetical protein
LHWYECLDTATLEVTGGQRHFVELTPFFKQTFLKTPKDLEVAVRKVAKELKKSDGISFLEGRKRAADLFGIDNHEEVTKISEDDNSCKQDIHALLQSASSRKLVRTVEEYLSLPAINTLKKTNVDEVDINVYQFDYIVVPLKACDKHRIEPSVINGDAYLPIVVVNVNGQLTDYQLPLEYTPYILDEIQSINHLDSKYKLILANEVELITISKKSGNFITTYILKEDISSYNYCDACGLPTDECICPEFDC